MRVLVGTILKSIPMISNVLILSIFMLLVFGIFGMQVFGGVLRNRCFNVGPDDQGVETATLLDIYPSDDADNTYRDQTCTNATTPFWPGYQCKGEGFVCLPYKNINDGYSGFDNMVMAFLTIFQMVTFSGWPNVMYSIQDGTSGLAFAYCVVVVYVGGFFVIELFLAVIADTYNEQKEEELCAKREAPACTLPAPAAGCAVPDPQLRSLADEPYPPALAFVCVTRKLEEAKAEAEEEERAKAEALAVRRAVCSRTFSAAFSKRASTGFAKSPR